MRKLLTCFLLASSPAFAEYIPGSDISVGNWSGGAYTYEDTGRFSHCVVSAPYLSGDTLFLSVNENATVSVGISSPSLNMTPGQEVPVTLYIDRRAPFYGRASAIDKNFARLVLPDFDNALTALKKGRVLVVESPIGRGTYDLSGTYTALDKTLNCALRNLHYVSGSPKQSPETGMPASGDKTLLFQVATGMIADLGMKDFIYLSDSETRSLIPTDAVAWSSPSMGILGAVAEVPASGIAELKNSDASDFAFLSKDCNGEVATTARNLSAARFPSRELRAMCVDGARTIESLLSKTLIGESVLYTMLVFDQSSSITEPQRRQELSEKAAIRAASYVKE